MITTQRVGQPGLTRLPNPGQPGQAYAQRLEMGGPVHPAAQPSRQNPMNANANSMAAPATASAK